MIVKKIAKVALALNSLVGVLMDLLNDAGLANGRGLLAAVVLTVILLGELIRFKEAKKKKD